MPNFSFNVARKRTFFFCRGGGGRIHTIHICCVQRHKSRTQFYFSSKVAPCVRAFSLFVNWSSTVYVAYMIDSMRYLYRRLAIPVCAVWCGVQSAMPIGNSYDRVKPYFKRTDFISRATNRQIKHRKTKFNNMAVILRVFFIFISFKSPKFRLSKPSFINRYGSLPMHSTPHEKRMVSL